MNERSRLAGRLPNNNSTRANANQPRGQRAWNREIESLPNDDLVLIARAITQVDRTVTGYRKKCPA
jgi:hypothetical protein